MIFPTRASMNAAALALVAAAVSSAGCGTSHRGETDRAEALLAELKPETARIAAEAEFLLRGGVLKVQEADVIGRAMFMLALAHHDRLGRMDATALADSQAGRRTWEKLLLAFENAVKNMDLFLASLALKWQEGTRGEAWFGILAAELAEAYDKLDQDCGVYSEKSRNAQAGAAESRPVFRSVIGGSGDGR